MRSLIGFAAALLLLALAPGALAASEWQVGQFSDEISTGVFLDVDCPSPSLCVAVGSDDAIASSSDPTGGIGAWRIGHLQEPGSYEELPPSAPATAFLPGAQIRGVSCPSTGFCVAATRLGGIFTTTDPDGGVGAWSGFHLQDSGPRVHMYGVSCPTVSFCVAVGLGGKIITSTDPAGGPGAWTTAQLPEPLELQDVSCASPTLCVAVADTEGEGAVLTSTNPAGGAAAWSVVHDPRFGPMMGVSCPSPSLCVTGNGTAVFSSTHPTAGAAAWKEAAGATPLQLTAFDCATTSACAAVNDNFDVIASTDPGGPASGWTFTNAVPYTGPNGAFGISCPAVSLCVAVGSHYLIATSTDPFGDGPAAAAQKSGLRRPTVKLTHHPRRKIRTAKERVAVHFRFREIGADVGFLCKLGRQKFRLCTSPRAYRVGIGRHAFRVKANDPGGPDQTVTTFRFRVIPKKAGR
ncbi:MAG TPA: hypothetical protein VFP17_08545 [Solirubrobacterales bacterium]|nr:hypothetical protein [Solirubrobacterales bacterium]